MEQLVIPILVGTVAFLAVIYGLMRMGKNSTQHQQKVLSNIYEEQEKFSKQTEKETVSILKADASPLAKTLMTLPFGQSTYELVLKSGMTNNLGPYLITCITLFIGAWVLIGGMSGLAGAIVFGLLFPRFYLKRRIKKRNETFINMFPDAVDMIVRSVKSGHPLNSALKMIAENMDNPVKAEFKQLVDEIAFGRSTTEALVRMSTRVDEPDLHFFVVILSVQQETGGNLAEVLSNLSGIIRKRKQLRLRIKALTSEGRATAYILGSLPFFVFGAIHMTSPDYLVPLFTTSTGHFILGTAVSLIALAAFIVYNMLQIDI